MRVYVPATIDDLRWLDSEKRLPAPVEGYAATAALLAELPDLSEEEAEFALTTAAAETSYETLVSESDSRGRRVVIVAEVAEASVQADGGSPGVVQVIADVDCGAPSSTTAHTVGPRSIDTSPVKWGTGPSSRTSTIVSAASMTYSVPPPPSG